MGLDAYVYKNKQHLPPEPEIQDVQRDALTGELNYSDETERKYGRDFFEATHKRLGNLVSISVLRDKIERLMGAIPTILRSRILYSAIHCGDAIAVSDLDQLEDEIQLIISEAGERGSSSLKTFLEDMTELIRTARYEQNPIAFYLLIFTNLSERKPSPDKSSYRYLGFTPAPKSQLPKTPFTRSGKFATHAGGTLRRTLAPEGKPQESGIWADSLPRHYKIKRSPPI